MPLTDAQLKGHARFDTLPLPQALARQTLPVEIDGQGYLVLGAPFSLSARQWLQAHAELAPMGKKPRPASG